ncbi:MAG: helix-turn-helix domain-containing protein, partial [Pseudonocardiaceae bacterium]
MQSTRCWRRPDTTPARLTVMEYGLSIGDRIRYWRKRRSLSQTVLANRVGRSESWLSQVERGNRPIVKLNDLIT